MTTTETVPASSVLPGDRVTEVGTPKGPWYRVLDVDSEAITVDAGLGNEVLPVTLPFRQTDVVLRVRTC